MFVSARMTDVDDRCCDCDSLKKTVLLTHMTYVDENVDGTVVSARMTDVVTVSTQCLCQHV